MPKKIQDSKSPFGYKKIEWGTDSKLISIPKEARTVKEIYELFASGKPITEIGDAVGMHSQKVHRILFDYQPVYTGKSDHERVDVLISPELAAAVNEKKIGRGGSRYRKSSLDDYISTAKAAEIINNTQDHIGLLCREGKIDCTKIGRNWLVNAESLKNYVPGPQGFAAKKKD